VESYPLIRLQLYATCELSFIISKSKQSKLGEGDRAAKMLSNNAIYFTSAMVNNQVRRSLLHPLGGSDLYIVRLTKHPATRVLNSR